MNTPEEILSILDACSEANTFPMLDNGYVYLAATRLGAFHAPGDWAMTIEVFGYSSRSGVPDLQIYTIGSRLRNRKRSETFVDIAAHHRYLQNHPHSESDFIFPVEGEDWQDTQCDELIAESAMSIRLRGRQVPIPSAADLTEQGIRLEEPPRLRVFEFCRFLAATERESVLATDAERRAKVPEDMADILCLDEWRHPDLLAGEMPSSTQSFVQLAEVLAFGDASRYRPTDPSNTDWRNWPEGGRL